VGGPGQPGGHATLRPGRGGTLLAPAPASQAVDTFEDVLRLWPSERTRGRGIHQAHLALACATAGEPERAAAEGMTAIGIAQTTRSDVTRQVLKRLDRQLAAHELPAVAEFREAVATL